MKTRILSIMLAIVLCLGVLPAAVFASGTESTQPDGSKWTVSGNDYQSNTRIDWPNFSTYLLGDQAAGTVVTVRADLRVGKQGDEATNAGGDAGFLFGIKDLNGDGVIAENDDQYYLVEFSGQMDANRVNVIISRNNKAWGPVRTVRYYCPNYASLTLTATYDIATATVNAYVNGELITSYTDPEPFEGTGYGLASKITDGVFRNVDTYVGTPDFIGLSDGDVFALEDDVYGSVVIPEGKTLTVDLNGHYVFAPIVNYGTLTLTNSRNDGFVEVRRGVSSERAETIAAIDNFGALTVDGANVRAYGKGTNPEPIAVRNRAGAHLTVLAGKIMSTMSGQKYGNAIMNHGRIDLIAGGELAAEITVPYDKDPTGNNVTINMQGAEATIGTISGGYLFARCNNNAGNTQYATVIRINNASQVVENISGGALRAYSLKKGSVQRVAFGILNESGTIKEISGGFIAGYTTATDFCFGIKNQNKIEKISGGYILFGLGELS